MPPKNSTKNSKVKPKPSTLEFRSSQTSSRLDSSTRTSKHFGPPQQPKGKQILLLPTLAGQQSERNASQPNSRTSEATQWSKQYPPTTTEELAVHKHKVERVAHWLKEVFDIPDSDRSHKRPRILALTGPCGSGKSTTIRVLAASLGIHIVEWKNGFDDWNFGQSDVMTDERLSLSRKFEQFLLRGNALPALGSSTPLIGHSTTLSTPRRLLLLEDIPNIQNPSIKESLHSALEAFVHSDSPCLHPLVVILSDLGRHAESWSSDSNHHWKLRQEEAIDFRSLFPKDLQNSPFVTQVSFNPIAMTLLRCGVSTVLHKRYPSSRHPFRKEIIDNILIHSNGDIRAAVQSFQLMDQFYFGHSFQEANRIEVLNAVWPLLETSLLRDQAIQMFHVIGKILYNKRLGDDPTIDMNHPTIQLHSLPAFLSRQERQPTQVNLVTLFEGSSIDSTLLALYLHQNYHLFCDDLRQLEGASSWFSLTDALYSNAEAQNHAPVSEYVFQLTSRGLLHSLPTPVPRKNQKITKPEWFDNLRRRKTAEQQIEKLRGLKIPEDLTSNNPSLRQSQTVIVTEFASVIRLQPSGLNHEAFTHFSERPRPSKSEDDDPGFEIPSMNGEFDRGNKYPDVDTGASAWLSDDEIED